MDTHTENDYLKPVPIRTGDLGKTSNHLHGLLDGPGVKGLLLFSKLSHPVYIAMPIDASQQHRHYAIRTVLSLAAFGNLFSHVQAINNEENLPDQHIVLEAHPDTEQFVEKTLYGNRLMSEIDMFSRV